MTSIDKAVENLRRRFERKIDSYIKKDKLVLRDLFYILNYLIFKKNKERVFNILELISHYQILKPTYMRFMYGLGDPRSRFNWTQLSNITHDYLGGFPTYVKGNNAFIYGRYPDIDSTALSVAILAKGITLLGDEKIYSKYRNNIVYGIKYLESRDTNNNGLLEQLENEDWMHSMLRCGSITYSNATALLALDWIISAAISVGDNEILRDAKLFRGKLLNAISELLYLDEYFIEGISCYGCLILRYSIDTVLLGLTSVSKYLQNKIASHLQVIGKQLLHNGLLKNIDTTQKNTRPETVNPGRLFNGGIWTLYNLLYLYSCLRHKVEPVIDVKLLYNNASFMWLDHKLKGYNDNYLPSIAVALYIYELFGGKLR